jgi:hypothetical protein
MLGIECADNLENLQHNPDTITMEMLNFIHDNCEEAFGQLKIWSKEKGVE